MWARRFTVLSGIRQMVRTRVYTDFCGECFCVKGFRWWKFRPDISPLFHPSLMSRSLISLMEAIVPSLSEMVCGTNEHQLWPSTQAAVVGSLELHHWPWRRWYYSNQGAETTILPLYKPVWAFCESHDISDSMTVQWPVSSVTVFMVLSKYPLAYVQVNSGKGSSFGAKLWGKRYKLCSCVIYQAHVCGL